MSLPPQHTILVVDRDHAVRTTLIDYLARHGYRADGAASAAEAISALDTRSYGLVLLDPNLPDSDGVELARQWREQSTISIIYISDRNEEADRVMGLELAADDYITKPFSLREVLARIRAVMRRFFPKAPHAPVTRGKLPRGYRFAGWTLNLNTRRLIARDQKIVSLTNVEFNMLVVFLSLPRRVISREKLLEYSRAFDDIYDRAIDVQILRLRRKLEVDPTKPTLLRTKRGVGYFLDAETDPLWS
ncbi:response regulator [Burkholderia ubonensis]|uniref:response regulator n=1 Tax=Burkholderia ubonensis TaxID=101571 RepID=UPI000754ECC9|nr:response regulator [Burkholderia ubonensis]KVT50522.1 two-component system response regulator [Burkholderia ubonensis]